jgi:hypothetical protein
MDLVLWVSSSADLRFYAGVRILVLLSIDVLKFKQGIPGEKGCYCVGSVFFFSNELCLESGLESSKNIDFGPDGKKRFLAQVV